MIKVSFFYQDNNIIKVAINGHANFDKLGKDIVCAAVSAIVFGTLNALDQLTGQKEVKIKQSDNKVVIEILQVTEVNQIILQTMLWQLQTISNQYNKNIVIKEVY